MASYIPNREPERKVLLACKVVDTVKAPKDFVRKFLPRELDILKKLNHPHIVHVHSIFQRRAKYYIFMRLAEKGDLLDWVLRHGTVTEGQSRVWLRQLTLGLQYLQTMDIAHRDLKCENVLITANYNAKMADFGFARYIVDNHGRRILSSTNCGSLSYAAPEILRGDKYDPCISDLWSLGVVLYIMLNKAMPFDDTNLNRLYDEQIHRRWRFCSSVVDSLSDQVKHLVNNLLEPDTRRRFHVDQVLASDWIAMDPRLAGTTPAESAALAAARQEQERRRRNRDRPDYTAPGASVAPLNTTTVQSEVREVEEDDVSVRLRETTSCTTEDMPRADPSETRLPRIEGQATPRSGEEVDILLERPLPNSEPAMGISFNLRTQPSHGTISIVESEPAPVTPPPEFLPAELSEKLTKQASSQISRKLEDSKADLGTTDACERLTHATTSAIGNKHLPTMPAHESLPPHEFQLHTVISSSQVLEDQSDSMATLETFNAQTHQSHPLIALMETKSLPPTALSPEFSPADFTIKVTELNTIPSHTAGELSESNQQSHGSLTKRERKHTNSISTPESLHQGLSEKLQSRTSKEQLSLSSQPNTELKIAASSPIEIGPWQVTTPKELTNASSKTSQSLTSETKRAMNTDDQVCPEKDAENQNPRQQAQERQNNDTST